jgi:hypothetical protein
MPARILVTGSREWTAETVIREALRETWAALGGPKDAVLVHGGCPIGADAIADRIWRGQAFTVEVHPADWSHGPAGGPLRNREMVDAGANVCLAFIAACTKAGCPDTEVHGSHGATGCADLAEEAGIPVWRVYDGVPADRWAGETLPIHVLLAKLVHSRY